MGWILLLIAGAGIAAGFRGAKERRRQANERQFELLVKEHGYKKAVACRKFAADYGTDLVGMIGEIQRYHSGGANE